MFSKGEDVVGHGKGLLLCQNLNFSFAFCVMFIFNKYCINIYISNCNKNIILHSAWAKLSMIVSTILNYIYRLHKGGYGCASWTIKKAERRRIDAFELWYWRRLLRVRWAARRSNQSILKEISPGCSLEGLILRLKLQYFGHLTQRADSLEKTLMLGGIESRRRRGWQRMRLVGWHHQLDGHGFGWSLVVGDGQGGLACCSSWGCKE